jgi:hypothetical protein
MNRPTNRFTMTAGAAVLLMAQLAYGQASTQLRVEIPFGFTAAGKEFPSGTYLFKGESVGRISFSNTNGKSGTILKVITSLARSSDADDHLLAFDKAGDTKILSEVWLHGREGALVHATPGEHQHEIVRLVAKSRIR